VGWLRALLQALKDLLRRIIGRPQCPIAWRPSALAPVFYGHHDVGATDGAPTDVRIFYPSLDGSPPGAEMLRDCGRYPLIVFAHGHCSSDTDHFKLWFEIPAQLARAGYVVAVPRLPQIAGGTSPSAADGDLQILRDLISWMRGSWHNRSFLTTAPTTGIVGHSFGAGLAGRLAAEGGIAAYASLSGSVATAIRTAITVPKLFMWGSNEFVPPGVALTDAEWSAIASPKHRIVIDDLQHWDYLRPERSACETDRGPCGAFWVTWDLITMFLARHIPPPSVPTLAGAVPDSLLPPLPLALTSDQAMFSGGWLSGMPGVKAGSGCRLTLTWELPGGAGSIVVP
jgi:dienelactone hydrolase